MLKVTPRERKNIRVQERVSKVLVPGPKDVHHLAKKGPKPVHYAGNSGTFVEKLIRRPTDAASSSKSTPFSDIPSFDNPPDFDTTPASPSKEGASPSKSYRQSKTDQWETWEMDVLPRLVPLWTRVFFETKGWRDAGQLPLPKRQAVPCSCKGRATWKVSIVYFTEIKDVLIDICACNPAPDQLLEAGLFPCAPIRPSVAVDVRVLDMVRRLFLRVAPNNTAWTEAYEEFLEELGFTLEHHGALRHLFAASLEWYTHLRNKVEAFFDQQLENVRENYLKQQDKDGSDSGTPRGRSSMRSPSISRSRSSSSSSSRSLSPTPRPQSKGKGKRKRSTSSPRAENPFPDPEPRARPSEYLRQRCPACFGGDLRHDPSATADVFVCVDACFTQKRNKSEPDMPKTHPDTHFIPEELSTKMEEYVERVRSGQSSKKAKKATCEEVEDEDDHYAHPDLHVSEANLDVCEESFTAADERRTKSSTEQFDITAIMGLLCRHDRVLWLLNMHSAGEKQFAALLLVEQLFQHLPEDTQVGLLYDIVCQLARSSLKWGYLERYFPRLAFAVAVFHAFGHVWPCQLVFHPRYREGFGFTNGEGCERFWHSISHLIAHLRISGAHHRLYVLDAQIKHADEASLFKLAEWNHRRALHSKAKRATAEEELEECEYTVVWLRKQWKAQVASQTKPVARMTKKSASEKAIAAILAQRQVVTILKERKAEIEAKALDAAESNDTDTAALLRPDLEKARAALTRAQTDLKRREGALGVDGRNKLNNKTQAKFLELRVSALALKKRLRDLLRAHKFEREALERNSRRQQGSDRNLHNHTLDAIKRRRPKILKLNRQYNETCDKIAAEIKSKRAPRRAVPPPKIDPKVLFQLDTTDTVWQDIGLEDPEDEEKEVPPWLGDETVRKGIRAMLVIDRANEEDRILEKERRSMRAWFEEEWAILNLAIQDADGPAEAYLLKRRRRRLLALCTTWRKYLPDTQAADKLPWGPSDEEVAVYMAQRATAARGRDEFEVFMVEAEVGSEAEEEEAVDFGWLDHLDTEELDSDSDDSDTEESDA